MKIQISEVWNYTGAVKKLAVIESIGNHRQNVNSWIQANRPDLHIADTVEAHGFHAVEVR